MSVRRPVAVGLARLTASVVGAAHHQGTALPGMVAERIWPHGFADLAQQLDSTTLVVGTNGKTTTAGLIAEILGRMDGRPIANRSGANLRQGIMSTLVRMSDLGGHLRPPDHGSRDAVFEVDEAALEQILPALRPAVIVATNLFRDQLDRYGEADSVVDRWTVALTRAAEGSVFIYCADDPRLAMLAAGSSLPTITFGLAGVPSDRDHPSDIGDAAADPVACRTCGRQLEYVWRSIGHLGSFFCPNGHVKRVAPDIAIELTHAASAFGVDQGPVPRTTLALSGRFGEAIAHPALPGLTNAYNVAAAAAAGCATGHEISACAEAMDGYVGPFGRFEWMTVDGRRVLLILVKNTISLAETVRLGRDLPADVVLIGLNDAPADGRDVSWIWDAPIADFVAGRAVVLTGSRSDDLCLRLKSDPDVVSTPPTSVQQTISLAAAFDLAIARAPRDGLVVAAATYTAMMGLRAIAERRGHTPAAPR